MSRFKKVLRYSSYLLGSRLLSRLLSIAFVVYAASKLGTELFGALSFALATVELLSAIGDLGLTRYGARELVRHWGERAVLSGEILTIQVLTSLLFSGAGLLAVLAWRPESPKLELLLLGLGAIFLSGLVNTTETIFIAGERFFYSALLTLIGRLIYVGAGFAALAAGASVVWVMGGFLAAVIVESLLRLAVVVRKITPFSFRFGWPRLKTVLIATIPFAVAAAANVIFLRINVMILELLSGDAAVGVFNVAFTLFTPFVWLPLIFSRAAFPGLTELYAGDREGARRHIGQWYRLMALAGIPTALTVSLLAGPLLSYFPSGYEESVRVLQILIWAFPMLLFTSIGFNLLQIMDRERAAAWALIMGAVLSAAFTFALVPRYGIDGAAAALVLATLLRELYIYYDAKRNFMKQHHLALFWRPALAGLAMALTAWALWALSPWLAVAAGLLVYTTVIFVSGGVRPAEIKQLLRG